MKIIYNSIIPFKGFSSINLFGVIFARNGENITQRTISHEAIHTEQMKELGYVLFYIWYLAEWVIRLFLGGNAYRNISFEREAYDNDTDVEYLSRRGRYSFLKHVFRDK